MAKEKKETKKVAKAEAEAPAKVEAKAVKVKSKKVVTSGKVFVTATFNNTLISITDLSGDVLVSGSCGAAGFKGARKSTPFAASTVMENVGKKARDLGVNDVEVYIKGPGAGRDAALRALKSLGFVINLIADITPIAHNGPRAKKERRV